MSPVLLPVPARQLSSAGTAPWGGDGGDSPAEHPQALPSKVALAIGTDAVGLLRVPSLWDEPGWGSWRAVGWAGAILWLLTALSARSRLHSNHLFCDCHLAWLSQWLRQRPTIGLFTQCAAPAQLRGLNVAEIQKNEFSCSGEGNRGGNGCQGRDTGWEDKAHPIDAAHLRSLPRAPAQSLDERHGLSSRQHCPWCGDNTTLSVGQRVHQSVPLELHVFCRGLGHTKTLCTHSRVPRAVPAC